MTMKKWIQVNELGELYKEYVLVHFDVPLLFVCKDNADNRYLVLCINEEEGQYLCLQISNKMLLKMLKKEITMAATFKQPSSKDNFLISYDFSCDKFVGHYIAVSDLTADMLPDERAYFELRNQKITEYISRIEKEERCLIQLEQVVSVNFDVLPVGTTILKRPIVYRNSQTWQVRVLQDRVNRNKYKNNIIENYEGLLVSIAQTNNRPKVSMRQSNNYFANKITDAYNTNTYNTESEGIVKCLMI